MTLVLLSVVISLFANPVRIEKEAYQQPRAESRATAPSTWRRIYGKDEPFSVLMPGEPSLYISRLTTRDSELTERVYGSYSHGSVYLVVSYNQGSIKDTLENFKGHHMADEATFERDIVAGDNRGKQYKLKFGAVVGALQIWVTKKHSYAVATVQAVDDPPLRDYFLSSFSLTEKGDDQNSRTWTHRAPPSPASNTPSIDRNESILTVKAVNRRVVIISKPEPGYTEEARATSIQGTVVLRAVFTSAGEVEHINTVRGLPKGLTERAISAARHIKFIPGEKDGRFASYWMQLEYNFRLN